MAGFKNRYYAVRHGESLANVAGIIVSDPAIGTVRYGLSAEGRKQVQRSASELGFETPPLIIASDFKRTAETAELIRDVLSAEPVQFDVRLRERFFGNWDGGSHENYSKAWEKDAHDSGHVFNGVESTNSVRERMWAVVESLETQFEGRNIILVSHGDPLMVLQTAFAGMDVREHRSLPRFLTAGWRVLNSI